VTACAEENNSTECTNSSFLITATLDFDSKPGVIILMSGVPQNGVIHGFRLGTTSRYYEIRVPDNGIQVRKLDISVQHGLHPPNVYVGMNSTLPNKDNYEWKHTKISDCLISIELPKVGRYFIQVKSLLPTAFTITGSLDETLIELMDGTPYSSRLTKGFYQYFSFLVNKKKDLTFSVTVMTGDTDLYISVGTNPTSKNSTWKALSYGSDAVYISTDDEHSCSDCVYILGVYGFTDSSFTVTATSESVIELSDGIPMHDNLLNGMMKYYSFMALNETTKITVSATIISGRLALYVNNGTMKPTTTSFV